HLSASDDPDQIILAQEPGKPPQKYRVLNTWRQADGSTSMQVKSLTTGEIITLGGTPVAPPLGSEVHDIKRVSAEEAAPEQDPETDAPRPITAIGHHAIPTPLKLAPTTADKPVPATTKKPSPAPKQAAVVPDSVHTTSPALAGPRMPTRPSLL